MSRRYMFRSDHETDFDLGHARLCDNKERAAQQESVQLRFSAEQLSSLVPLRLGVIPAGPSTPGEKIGAVSIQLH